MLYKENIPLIADDVNMKTVVVIGGGIAGTSCAEYIEAYSSDEVKIVMITSTDIVKTAVTTKKITNMISEMNIVESTVNSYEKQFRNVSVLMGYVTEISVADKYVMTSKNETIKYDKVCICTGAKPNTMTVDQKLFNTSDIIYIRDTDTVQQLKQRLSNAKKVIVIGNGGIALELVYEIRDCDITWCVKHDYIGNTFLDKGAATFMLPVLNCRDQTEIRSGRKADQTIFQRRVYEVEREFIRGPTSSNESFGSALGPDWSVRQNLHGCKMTPVDVHVIYNCEPRKIYLQSENNVDKSENIYVKLTNGEVIGGDVVVCATGATPHVPFKVISLSELKISKDGGICVDENMRTNLNDVYAAGDVCSPSFEQSQHWFPMKLWTQGCQMGAFAGKCIAENFRHEDLPLDFCFELFTHATTFFGYKVCLLGCYNMQKMRKKECEFLFRCTPGVEYIKLVLKYDRVQGAILIGETDLEETVQNLIVNQLNIGAMKEHLLDPRIDIEDFFD